MPAFPKLPGKPECLGFRKTIVVNKDEHQALLCLLDDAIQFCDDHEDDRLDDSRRMFVGIQDKLNAPSPNPN